MHNSTFATASISGKAVFIDMKEVVQVLLRKALKNAPKIKMLKYLYV